jgi:hypothetical protein
MKIIRQLHVYQRQRRSKKLVGGRRRKNWYKTNKMSNIVTIRCIRDFDCNSKDDIIRIVKKDTTFTVRHTVPENQTIKSESIKSSITLNFVSLYDYMNTLIELLHRDALPFKAIQFDFMCMPAVVLTPKNLKKSKEIILKYVNTLAYMDTTNKTAYTICSSPGPLAFDTFEDMGMSYYT